MKDRVEAVVSEPAMMILSQGTVSSLSFCCYQYRGSLRPDVRIQLEIIHRGSLGTFVLADEVREDVRSI